MLARRFLRAAPYAAMLAASMWLYWAATGIDAFVPPGRAGPDLWPRILLGCLALVCVYEGIRQFALAGETGVTGALDELLKAGAGEEVEASARLHPARLWTGIALTAAYVAAVGHLGFFLATAVYMTLFVLVGGYPRKIVAMACGLSGSLVLMFLFMKVVYVSLPLGEGPFRALSLTLMAVMGVR